MVTKTFRLPPGCSIKSITIRETTLEDELAAAEVAHATGDNPAVSFVELVKAAIVAVDGRRVEKPYNPPNWSTRTWKYLTKYFQVINGAEVEKAAETFIKAAVDWTGGLASVADEKPVDDSGESGSG
jgi:hypothetical protein